MKEGAVRHGRNLLAAILAASLCVAALPVPVGSFIEEAEAATLQRGDVARAASGGIVLDTDLHTKQPRFNKTTSTTSAPSASTIDTVYTYWYSLAVPAKTYRKLDTTVSVRWNDVGFDADDDRIDLVLSWLPDSRWYSNAALSRVPLLQRYDRNSYGSAGICVGVDGNVIEDTTCCEQHLKIEFYKHGTSTSARGSFLMKVTDLDGRGWDDGYDDRWCESIEFISGHAANMYVPNGNVLNIGANRKGEAVTDFRATREMDGSSLDSGVVTQLSSGAEFWCYSTHGWTDILDQFDARKITLSATTGGKVHCKGKTNSIAVGWRGSRTVSIEPTIGYKISNVVVDGKSVGVRSTYPFTNVTQDRSISASFSPIDYTIKFHSNGGIGKMSDLSIAYDETKKLTGNAYARAGYRFSGWSTTADGTGTAFQNEQKVKNLRNTDGTTVDLYAQWTPISYRIVFCANEGEGTMGDQTLTYDRTQSLRKNTFTREGHAFSGWALNADGLGNRYSDEQAIKNLSSVADARITLYAIWKPIDYCIAFDANGGDGEMADQTIAYGNRTALDINRFSRKGYLFAGWNTKKDGTGTPFHDLEEIENLSATEGDTVHLFAQWEPINYFVAFDAQGGSGTMSDQLFTFDQAQALQANGLHRTGFRWIRWDVHPSVSTAGYEDEQIVKNLTECANETVTLYAIWAANRCLIVFDSNGGEGTMRAQSLAYGTAEPLHANEFHRDGYEWTSWNTEPDGSGTAYGNEASVKDLSTIDNSTVILYAQWREKTALDQPQDEDPPTPDEGPTDPDDDVSTPNDDGASSDDSDQVHDSSMPNDQADETNDLANMQPSEIEDENEGQETSIASTLESKSTNENGASSPTQNVNGLPFAKTGKRIIAIVAFCLGGALLGVVLLVAAARKRKRAAEAKRQFYRMQMRP